MTVVRSSYLHNGFSDTGKMISLYKIGALVDLVWSGSASSLALEQPYDCLDANEQSYALFH